MSEESKIELTTVEGARRALPSVLFRLTMHYLKPCDPQAFGDTVLMELSHKFYWYTHHKCNYTLNAGDGFMCDCNIRCQCDRAKCKKLLLMLELQNSPIPSSTHFKPTHVHPHDKFCNMGIHCNHYWWHDEFRASQGIQSSKNVFFYSLVNTRQPESRIHKRKLSDIILK
jgi:hypothetical protein